MTITTIAVTVDDYGLGNATGWTFIGGPIGDVDPDPALIPGENPALNWDLREITFYDGGACEMFFEELPAGDSGVELLQGTFDHITVHHSGPTPVEFNMIDIGSGGDLNVGFSIFGVGSASLYFQGVNVDNLWDSADDGLTFDVEFHTDPFSAENTDIVREDFAETATMNGEAQIAMDDFEVDEMVLVSVSAQYINLRRFAVGVIDGMGNGVPVFPVHGLRVAPDPYDSHQWFWARIQTAGTHTISATANLNPRLTIPFGLRVWRISGQSQVHPIVNQTTIVGDTSKELGTIIDTVLNGDNQFGTSTGALTKAAIFTVMLNTNIDPGTISNAGFTEENPDDVPVEDFGAPNSFTDISFDMELNSGAFSGFQFNWNFTEETVYLASVIQLRSQKTFEFHTLARRYARGQAGIAVPQDTYTTTHSAEITGGRRTGLR